MFAWSKHLAVSLGALPAIMAGSAAGEAAPCAEGILSGATAMNSDWRDDRPGLCRQILPADLGAPSASTTSTARVIPRPHSVRERLPQVPAGFTVQAFRIGSAQPRLIRAAPNGDIFVADSQLGRIRVLRPGRSLCLGGIFVFAADLDLPFGIAFYPPGPNPQYLYVAENSRVVRFPYVNGMVATTSAPEVVVPDLPQGAGNCPARATGPVTSSSRRTETMFVSVAPTRMRRPSGEDETGSRDDPAFDPDGTQSAECSPAACAIRCRWHLADERRCSGPRRTSATSLGDELVPDFVTAVRRASSSAGRGSTSARTSIPGTRQLSQAHPPVNVPSYCSRRIRRPGLGVLHWHAVPRGISGQPVRRRARLVESGEPAGSKVIRSCSMRRLRAAYYEDFMTGFVVANHDVWGRPVGVAVGADGSLFVSEDANKTIWCVSYTGVTP